MRHGTSLLEVMFAMGVAIIGLLGVAALIPVAAHRMGRGIQADQVSAYGRAVVAEFDIRGMGHRNNFTWWNPNNGQLQRFQQSGAFCIDPLIASEPPPIGANAFPLASGTFSIPRVSLQRFTSIPPRFGLTAAEARLVLYDDLFRFDDDLVFNRPVDRTIPAIQLFSSAPVPGDPIKRQYNGRYTWMATMSPSQNASAQSNMFTLSVIVFEGRDLDPTSEVVMPVTFLGGGFSGGDVGFGNPLSPHLLVDVDLRPEDWVMLSSETTPRFVRWYRVASANREIIRETIGGVAEDRKYAHLIGADWPATINAQATWIDGVVGVFEKTFRLEDSSLWKIK